MKEHSNTQPWSTFAQEPSPSSLPASPIAAGPSPRPQHTWLAVLTLYFLSPIIAELLTGGTPPLMWNNVGGIILTTGLYGSGAILARELVRRRGLGWGHLALLGAAYGILEEGMAYQSWFNPRWIDPPDAARLFQVNWMLALVFTTIHVTLSIMSSVIIAEALFPRQAERPWLGKKGFIGLTLWLGLVASVLFFTYGFVNFHGKGYDHPPVTYGIAPILFVLFLWLGLRQRKASFSVDSEEPLRPAPNLWMVRLAAFIAASVVLVNLFLLRNLIPIAFIPFGIVAGVDILSVLVVRQWSKRFGWGANHRLALVSGVMGVFILCSPIFEFVLPRKPGQNAAGLTLVNLLALAGLIWLTWQMKRQGNIRASASPKFQARL